MNWDGDGDGERDLNGDGDDRISLCPRFGNLLVLSSRFGSISLIFPLKKDNMIKPLSL